MTPQSCQTWNDTISSNFPTKRKRIRQAVELNGCLLGILQWLGWLNHDASRQAVKLSG